MAEIIYDDGADLSLIQSKKVAIIGYGSQGHAHALNLKDSGVDVVVGLRPGSSSWAKAEAAGLEVKDVAEAVAEGDVVSVLLPDQVQRYVYAEQIAPNLKEGSALLFAHGFNIRYGYIEVPAGHDVIMVAPKGPGHKVRETYVQGKGTRTRRRRGGCLRQGLGAGPVLREGHRRYPRRRYQDDLHRGDRDRPVRRAGRAVRWRLSPDPGWL